ncbi:MAG: hypothetical protein CMD16_02455 [Flavobacteriales bacterium]|nr:hypothetical protein [Flavobacteriales bacterium]|tara:strand:- start:1710 stop:2585 length:876 start_codon:yes stop_codon:yes gene_type:complete
MDKLIRNYVIIFFLAVIWGSSFILMKRGLDAFTYTQVSTLRLFIAFLALLPFVFSACKKAAKKHWKSIIIVAFLGNGIPAFLFAKAQIYLESSLVGILNSLTPLFTLILGVYFFRAKPSRINVIGIIIGLSGALILFLSDITSGFSINYYVLFVILATAFYATSINVIRKYLSDLDAISISALAFLFLGPASAIYLFSTDFLSILFTDKGKSSFVYIVILGVFGTSFAVVIFNKLIQDSSAIFASSVTYLIPIVALLWGVFDEENITIYYLAGVVIILSGVYLVNRDPNKG